MIADVLLLGLDEIYVVAVGVDAVAAGAKGPPQDALALGLAQVISGGINVASVPPQLQDIFVYKQEGLDKRLQYDAHLRKSLLDHFYAPETTLDEVAGGRAAIRGDFVGAPYEARIRRNPDRIQVLLIREGTADGLPVRITKGVTATAGSAALEIAYLLEGLPRDHALHFGVEFNFAGLPAGADDRYFHNLADQRLGQLGSRLDLTNVDGIAMTDQWLGIDVGLKISRPTHLWTFPIETVSQSEGGFELVHQSVVVHPHWIVVPDAEGRWSVAMTLSLDTSLAESRLEKHAVAVGGVG